MPTVCPKIGFVPKNAILSTVHEVHAGFNETLHGNTCSIESIVARIVDWCLYFSKKTILKFNNLLGQ